MTYRDSEVPVTPDPADQPPDHEQNRRMALIAAGVLAALLLVVIVLALLDDDEATADGATTSSAPTVATTEAGSSNDQITESIRQVQTALSVLGYYSGEIDGVYGDETVAAVSAFQADEGITVDGRYGPETHQAMVDRLGEDAPDIIASLQRILTDLGLYEGPIDGVYGAATQAAVRSLQASCQIAVDGIYGPDTHQCLVDTVGGT